MAATHFVFAFSSHKLISLLNDGFVHWAIRAVLVVVDAPSAERLVIALSLAAVAKIAHHFAPVFGAEHSVQPNM